MPLADCNQQIHMSYHQTLIMSFATRRTAYTTCLTGRWRCAPFLHLDIHQPTDWHFAGPEGNDILPWTVMVLLLRGLQSHTLRSCFNRAGPPRRPHRIRLTDGTARARRGEDPIPKHSGERGEQPELYPYTADSRAASPLRAFP